MANNRIYLCYRPTGRVICIGKRFGWGWHPPYEEMSKELDIFYRACEEDALGGSNQDDFCLLMEDASGAQLATDRWVWTEDGGVRFVNDTLHQIPKISNACWLVGREIGVTWEIAGIYTSKARAMGECRDKTYFVAAVTLDEALNGRVGDDVH